MADSEFNKYIPYLEVQDFDKNGNLLVNGGNSVVLVWASWCPHCVHAKPEYAKAAKMVKSRGGPNLLCLQHDGERDSEKKAMEVVSKAHKVKGFPTVLLFKNGKMVKTFSGDRTAENFVKFANS
jgi:thiol-disulfide isomerase/thioredoxin